VIVARTPRLVLRRWELADAGATDGIYGDAETMRYFGDGSTFTPDELRASLVALIAEYDRFGYGNYAVVEASSNAVIGHAGVRTQNPRGRFEAEWLIARTHRGRGYGFEAACAALERAFEIDRAEEIWAVAHRDNRASIRLMQRTGMTLREELTAHGVPSVAYAVDYNAFLTRSQPRFGVG
jgi:RimJ/RimL family protein N-acetyltransferase